MAYSIIKRKVTIHFVNSASTSYILDETNLVANLLALVVSLLLPSLFSSSIQIHFLMKYLSKLLLKHEHFNFECTLFGIYIMVIVSFSTCLLEW